MTPEETPQDTPEVIIPEGFSFNALTVLEDLSFGDAEDVEDVTGLPVGMVQTTAKGLRGLVWVVLRKTNPSLTFEQTRSLPLSTIIPKRVAEQLQEEADQAEAALEDAEGKEEA